MPSPPTEVKKMKPAVAPRILKGFLDSYTDSPDSEVVYEIPLSCLPHVLNCTNTLRQRSLPAFFDGVYQQDL